MDQTLRRERSAPWAREHPFQVDVALATAVWALTSVVFTAGAGLAASSTTAGVLLCAPIAWRRRAPVAAAGAFTVVGLVQLVAYASPLGADLSALVLVYSLAAYAPRWGSRLGLAAGVAGAGLAGLRFSGDFVYYLRYDLTSLVLACGAMAVTVLAAWALGNLRRSRMQQVLGLEERARLLEVERDQEIRLAASTERARIAREMHDVVAHSLSVVIAQADGGRYAGADDPTAATAALEQISATGRQALTDMRALLGVLREGGTEEYAPQPDVAAVRQLVADLAGSGLDVDLLVEGDPQPMGAGPQLAAYRIVQESLTNVLKHAGPASRAWVRLAWRPHALELSVLDDGRGAGAVIGAADGLGQGLIGMRERASLHSGWLADGPRSGGGFSVSAELPYGSAR